MKKENGWTNGKYDARIFEICFIFPIIFVQEFTCLRTHTRSEMHLAVMHGVSNFIRSLSIQKIWKTKFSQLMRALYFLRFIFLFISLSESNLKDVKLLCSALAQHNNICCLCYSIAETPRRLHRNWSTDENAYTVWPKFGIHGEACGDYILWSDGYSCHARRQTI